MKLRKIAPFVLAMTTILFSTTLTSCTDTNNDPVDNTKTYSIGYSEISMSNGEWEVVLNAYYKTLGVTKSTFELSGSDIAANDATVKAKCEEAKKSLENTTLKGHCTISVKRGTNPIHSAQFGTIK